MTNKIFAVAGSFAMRPGTEKGLHIFFYEPKTAEFTPVGDFYPDINAGQRAYNMEKNVLYLTHEVKEQEGELGGGGSVYSFRLDKETGIPTLLNKQDTGSTLPSDILFTADGGFLLVPHHCSGNVATKIRKSIDGRLERYTESDDCTLAVFPVREDGSVGELSDIFLVEEMREDEKIKKLPHLHNCIQSPDGKLIAVCDKGLDMIHTFRFDDKAGTIFRLEDTKAEDGTHPRYGVFHPALPVLYTNCENSAYLHVWKYDSETGKLDRMQVLPLLANEVLAAEWTKEGASDIVVTEDAKYLYVSIRGLNRISAFRLLEDGRASLIGDVDCQGSNPRGLCLSPDERYLFAMNRDSDCIARFLRQEDGSLLPEGAETRCSLPGNLIFITFEGEETGKVCGKP